MSSENENFPPNIDDSLWLGFFVSLGLQTSSKPRNVPKKLTEKCERNFVKKSLPENQKFVFFLKFSNVKGTFFKTHLIDCCLPNPRMISLTL